MATANDLISRAMRLIGVVDANLALEANQAQDALAALNAMLAEWHEADIGLPDYSFDSLTDTLATDAADSEAIAYQLGLRIAPEYGIEPSPRMERSAEEAMNRLRLRYFQPGQVDAALPRGRHAYDIELD